MDTNEKNNGAAAEAGAKTATRPTETAAPGPVDAGGLSTEQLARNLAKTRTSGSEPIEDKADAAAEEAPENEGPGADEVAAGDETETLATEATPEAGSLAAGLAELKLTAEQTAAIAAVVTKGEGELDAETLKLTPEQITGLEKLLAESHPEAASAEANEADEPLDLSNVPKLTDQQKRHVGELFKTRIGKVLAKERGKAEATVKAEREARAAAEGKVQTLERQLAERPQPASAEPLAEITTTQQLQKATHDAQSVKTWATRNLALVNRRPEVVEAALKENGVKLKEFTSEAMEDWLIEAQTQADRMLTADLPRRKDYLTQEAQFSSQADRAFPQFADKTSKFYQDAVRVLQTIPEIRRLPHWKIAAGVYARGLAIVEAEQAAAAKGNGAAKIKIIPRTRPPKVTVRAAGAGRRTTPEAEQGNQAEQEFRENKSTAGLAKMFATKRTAA